MLRRGLLLAAVALCLFPRCSGNERQVCFKYAGPCPNYPDWDGTHDDSDWAYENQNVREDLAKCMARAKEYFEWCGCEDGMSVIVVHMPSAAWTRYPAFERQVVVEEARGSVRVLELAMRYRSDEWEYSFPKGKLWLDAHIHLPEPEQRRIEAARTTLVSGVSDAEDAEGASSEIAAPGGSASGGFLEGARLLLSQAGRNVTEAFGALREAGKLNGNAELLDILLGAGPSSKGLTVDPATIQRLEHCAWASNNPMCRLALGYRYHAGLGVEPSCAKAAVHWRLAADETMALNRLDGGVFPLHEVRLSQATEVRRQERKDAAIEMKREQARRGDPAAAAAVGAESYFQDRDIDQAAKHFAAAAAKGDAMGLNNLGSMLLNGIGGYEKDEALAFKSFERSAALVNPYGMYNLAVCLMYGQGTAANHSAAFSWLHKAAGYNNPAAHQMLAHRYRDGHGVEKNIQTAYEHYDSAARLGDIDALVFLAMLLLDASHFDPQCRIASKALGIAAGRGPWSQTVKEGYDAYRDGDPTGAYLRYRLAAEAGIRSAQVNVGFLHEQGIPGLFSSDTAEAALWYEAAAQQGDVPARRRIGDLIHQGAIFAINGTPDHARAVQAYASLPSDAEAVHSLAYMHEHGLGTDRNASEALRLYAHAAHLGRNATARGSPKESLPATEGQIASEAAAVALSIKEAARSVAASFSSFFAFGKKKEGGEL